MMEIMGLIFGSVGMSFGILGYTFAIHTKKKLEKLELELKKQNVLSHNVKPN